MKPRHTLHGGKSKDSKVVSQSIIVKIDRQKHYLLRQKCLKHGETMASVIRKAIDTYLEGGEKL